MAQLQVQLLGSFQATAEGAPLTGFDSDKVRALLAYLIVESNRPHRRERLAGLLWPDSAERSARTSLRRALSNLRQVIGDRHAEPPFLIVSRQNIQFNQLSDHKLDVAGFRSLLAGGDRRPGDGSHLERAMALYQGDFLEGFSLPDSTLFEEWILVSRESLRRQALRTLSRLANDCEKQGARDQALRHVRRLIALDPYQETAHQQLMRLLARSGRRNEAIAHYEHMVRLLDTEMGLAPSAQSRELHQKLRAEDYASSSRAFFQDTPQSVEDQPAGRLPAHQLPAQMTRFVGRQREIAEIEQLLQTTRLLTLVGPPGTGKSRLALEAAWRLDDQYAGGICFVNLAPINDTDLVLSTIARVLGLQESGQRPLGEIVKNHLRRKHLLLLLDNFEHLIEAAPLVKELLTAAPGLQILVTSREPLQLYGEQEYPVPPLMVPDLAQPATPDELSQVEAVELFIQHARAVKYDFALEEENATVIAEICAHLDGLPLAIELAAAQVKLFSPQLIHKRLDDRFATLTGGSRFLPDRQQTLKAAIDWSYELLTEDEKRLFARLSVFQGGRRVEAVEAVCNQDLNSDVLAMLESLLNKSLLQQHPDPDGETRFIMLETIHEYARQRLQENGETEMMRKRHAHQFLALAEQAERGLSGPGAVEWCARLHSEMDNLRAALSWALANGEALVALRLASALREYWYDAGQSAEGLKWANQALELAADAEPALLVPAGLKAKALNTAGMLSAAKAEYERARRIHRAALALAREAGEALQEAWALVFLSWDTMNRPDAYEVGLAYCQEALALFQDLDERLGVIQALNMIGELSRLCGNYERAEKAYEDCLAACRQAGHKVRELSVLGNLAFVANYQGDYERAYALEMSSLPQFRDLALSYQIVADIAVLVGTFTGLGELDKAARLLGAVETLFENMGAGLKRSDQVELDRYASALRRRLDRESFAAAYEDGASLSMAEAVALILR